MSEPIILVPLDGTKQALAALPVAKVLGEIERAALHILYVGDHELAGEELRSRLGREAPVLDGLTIDSRVGTPAVQILQVAGEMKPRVIVMCRHSGAERGKMLGRTAMKVLHDASCPVVLVPAGARCNAVAASSCLGAARWDTLHQHRTTTRGRACRTWSRRTSGGPRNGHQGCSNGARLSHNTALCRSATTRMARLGQRVFKSSRERLPARPLARADVPRPWRYCGGNPAVV